MILKAVQETFKKYNKCEELNTKHYLLNDFVNIIERKGYEWEISNDKAKKKVKNMIIQLELKVFIMLKQCRNMNIKYLIKNKKNGN